MRNKMKKLKLFIVASVLALCLVSCGKEVPALSTDLFNYNNSEFIAKCNEFASICPWFDLEKEQVILTTKEFCITNKYILPFVYGEIMNYTAEDFKTFGTDALEDHIKEMATTRALSEALYREAVAAGCGVSDQSADNKFNEYAAGELGTFLTQIDQTPFTPELLKQDIKYTMTVESYKEQIIGKVDSNVSEKDARKYYNDNPEMVTRPKRAVARHIFKNTQDMKTEEEKTKALEEMKELRAKIDTTSDFLKMVPLYSEDGDTKNDGGLIAEYIEPGQAAESIDSAIFAQPSDGGISDVVVSNAGYHIFMVDSITAEYKIPFEEIEEQIKKVVFIEQQNKAIDQEVLRVKKKYRIH